MTCGAFAAHAALNRIVTAMEVVRTLLKECKNRLLPIFPSIPMPVRSWKLETTRRFAATNYSTDRPGEHTLCELAGSGKWDWSKNERPSVRHRTDGPETRG